MQTSKDTITCTYSVEFPWVVFVIENGSCFFSFSSYKRSAPLVGTQNALVSRWVLRQMEVTQTVLLDWYRGQGEWYQVQKNLCLMKRKMMMIDSVLQQLPVRLRSWLKVTRLRIAQSMSNDHYHCCYFYKYFDLFDFSWCVLVDWPFLLTVYN